MVGGAGVGGNEKEDVNCHWTNQQEMSKIAKLDVCKLSMKSCLLFFFLNRFNDPDCKASTKAMGMLSEQNKQG